eukprot:evm.model.scf_81.7 EVM.evm.TU.scf_81.7   scf_81:74400-78145(-)
MNSHQSVFSSQRGSDAKLVSSTATSCGGVRTGRGLGAAHYRECRVPSRDGPAQHSVVCAAHKLMEIETNTILDDMGYIRPEVEGKAQAFVFAIYDENQKLQYIGFSKDLQSSLRTLFSRRPEKAYYYKYVSLPEVDQKEMVATRGAWFEEVGGPPPGNKLAMERAAWQQPVDAGAISDRGKLQAAEEKSKDLLEAIRKRGCREQFMPNASLLVEGQVDFVPAEALSPEELEKQKKEMERIMQASKKCKTVVDGQESDFTLFFKSKFPTNGGYMIDVSVNHDNVETRHRIIIGKDYYEPYKVDPESVVELVFSFLLANKVPRHTEGMLLSSQFPINYFSISELEQWFDEFKGVFSSIGDLKGSEFWRFNRLFDYGGVNDNLESLNMALAIEDSSDSA